MYYDITPVPAPRMTVSDKWKQRPCVMRYRAFRDEVRFKKVFLPEQPHIIFYMPMPKSWSAKKKKSMDGKPHKQKSDLDNLVKALFDALFENDCHIWDFRVTKRWGTTGGIEIRNID